MNQPINPMGKVKDVYIVRFPEEDRVIACFKEDVDDLIRHYETHDDDIDWSVIARIPFRRAVIDLNPADIDWFEGTPDKLIVDRAILSTIQLIKHG